MVSEEKLIANMRRQKGRLIALVVIIAVFIAVETYAIYALNHMHNGLEQLNRNLYLSRGPQYELLLAQTLEGQSKTEIALAKTYMLALTHAILLGTLIGFFVVTRQQSRLNVGMWDRLKYLEEELLRIKQRELHSGTS